MALLVPGLLRAPLRIPGRTLLASAGRTLSYPVYLWHPLVIFGLAAAGIGGWGAIGLTLVATLVLAACSWQLVERPTLAFHRQLRARAGDRDGSSGLLTRRLGSEGLGRSTP